MNVISFRKLKEFYQMVTRISFEHKRIMIKWLGTHAKYDRITAKTI